jgi:pimeloyl-ACP methyl ester carboxylesterase
MIYGDQRIKLQTSPDLAVHGDQDRLIPVQHGRRLASAASSSCSVHLAVAVKPMRSAISQVKGAFSEGRHA